MSPPQQDTSTITGVRRLPVGAEVLPEGGVQFRVWSPNSQHLEVVLLQNQTAESAKRFPLTRDENGYFSGIVESARAGSLYWYRLDHNERLYPDPASRFQPEGVHGSSQVIDPTQFPWTDANWPGVQIHGQVIYEMHIGTFTREGTWTAAIRQLHELADLGITVLEVMPVAEFPGRFGWGYDGVDLFAPTHLYGTPDDFRRFVDQAHALGLGVILDVVYNHLGPDGNYLKHFSKDYFSKRHTTEWGEAINFDDHNSGPVRELFLANAAYWIQEFHLDGLRLDATQDINDESPDHILAAITRSVRQAAGNRSTIVVAENEPQRTRLVRPLDQGGFGMDAVWNDDFHHSAMVALSGRKEAYYSDYLGKPQEFISAAKWGYLYQGQWYRWQKKRRGTPTFGLKPEIFINFIQNHDQIANTSRGLRCHQIASPGRLKAMTAILLLSPGTPMLFQGQEFGASTPFFYFADHKEELARLIHESRKKFMAQFPSISRPEIQATLPDPADPGTFIRVKLNASERQMHEELYALHRDLLRLRREDPVISAQRPQGLDGAVLSDEAFLLRYFGENGDDRLLIINLEFDLYLDPAPEPLMAPPEGQLWNLLWSSEDLRYGGGGTPPLDIEGNWLIPGQSAILLAPQANSGDFPPREGEQGAAKG